MTIRYPSASSRSGARCVRPTAGRDIEDLRRVDPGGQRFRLRRCSSRRCRRSCPRRPRRSGGRAPTVSSRLRERPGTVSCPRDDQMVSGRCPPRLNIRAQRGRRAPHHTMSPLRVDQPPGPSRKAAPIEERPGPRRISQIAAAATPRLFQRRTVRRTFRTAAEAGIGIAGSAAVRKRRRSGGRASASSVSVTRPRSGSPKRPPATPAPVRYTAGSPASATSLAVSGLKAPGAVTRRVGSTSRAKGERQRGHLRALHQAATSLTDAMSSRGGATPPPAATPPTRPPPAPGTVEDLVGKAARRRSGCRCGCRGCRCERTRRPCRVPSRKGHRYLAELPFQEGGGVPQVGVDEPCGPSPSGPAGRIADPVVGEGRQRHLAVQQRGRQAVGRGELRLVAGGRPVDVQWWAARRHGPRPPPPRCRRVGGHGPAAAPVRHRSRNGSGRSRDRP